MNPGTRKSEKGKRVAARTSAYEADEEKKERARRDQIKETSIQKDAATLQRQDRSDSAARPRQRAPVLR